MSPTKLLPASGKESVKHIGLTCLALLILAYLFGTVLIYDSNDNAYIGMVLIAVLLVFTAVPFGLSVFSKEAFRLVLLRAGLLLLILSTLFGVYALVSGLSALDQYTGNQREDLRESHLLGLIVLPPSSLLILASYWLTNPYNSPNRPSQ